MVEISLTKEDIDILTDKTLKEYLKESTKLEKEIDIFKNEHVLSPNYIPDKIFHRDREIKELINNFLATTEGKWCGDLSIFGATGSGKTLITTIVFNILSRKAQKTDYVFLNCSESKTPTAICQTILRQLSAKHPKNMGLSYYIKELKSYIDNRLLVLIIDEIDLFLKRNKVNEEMIQIFADWNNCVLVFISNDQNWHRLITDHRTLSRLHLTKMIFFEYDKNQIFDILLDRADSGLVKESFDKDIIEKIADLSAQSSGDARFGVRLLYLSAKIAEKNYDIKITPVHLAEAKDSIESDNSIDFIDSLSPQKKVILIAIRNCNRMFHKSNINTIYREYEGLIRFSKKYSLLSKNTVMKYLKEFETYNLIEKRIGRGRGRNRGREPTQIIPKFDLEAFDKLLSFYFYPDKKYPDEKQKKLTGE